MAYNHCATPRGPEEHLRDGESCQICKDWMKQVGAKIVKGKVIAPKPSIAPAATKRVKAKRRKVERKPYNLVLEPCGTNAAALRHRRRGEPLCVPCREAKNAYAREIGAKRRRAEGKPVRPKVVEREHGTLVGWRQHKNRDEEVCEPCRLAKSAQSRLEGRIRRAREKARARG